MEASASTGLIASAADRQHTMRALARASAKDSLCGSGATLCPEKLSLWRRCVDCISAPQVNMRLFCLLITAEVVRAGTLLLLNAWMKRLDASELLSPLNSIRNRSGACELCSTWQLRAPVRVSQTPWFGPAADELKSGGPAAAVCVLPA